MREGGHVSVKAWRDAASDGDAGFLRLLVVDTGMGMPANRGSARDGVGLANIESRLRHYFGASAAMTIRATPGGGTTVELCMPWIATEAPLPSRR